MALRAAERMGVLIDTTTTNNVYLVISSVEPEEQGFCQRIRDDLQPIMISRGQSYLHREPQTAAQFLMIIDAFTVTARPDAGPIIHIDAHGSQERGVYIAGSGEYIPWPTLFRHFQSLNYATGNNLVIISAVCFSFDILGPPKIHEPCPFSILIAPHDEVTLGFLQDNLMRFYSELSKGKGLVKVYKKYLQPQFGMFFAAREFARAMVQYFRTYYMGKARDRLFEDWVTKLMEHHKLPNNHAGRKEARRLAKLAITPTQFQIDRAADIFLIGKRPNFTLQDLLADARRGFEANEVKKAHTRRSPKLIRPQKR